MPSCWPPSAAAIRLPRIAPYQCATVDAYADLKQLVAPAGGNYLPKIHPTKTRAELWKQTTDNATPVKADVNYERGTMNYEL